MIDLEGFPSLKEIWTRLNEPGYVVKLRAIGDILRYAIAVVAIVVAYFFNPEIVWPLIQSIALTQLIIELMKKLMNRTPWGKRPDGADNGFPSGHVGGAFSGAWFFYFAFGWQVALIPLLLGAVTALSRVLPKKHSWVQVTVGALVAFVVAFEFLA